MSEIKTIGVIGCGTMGLGIAQIAVMNNHQVLIYDTNQIALDRAKKKLHETFQTLIEKNKTTATEVDRFNTNLYWCMDLKNLSDCDLIIEAIVEDFNIKKEFYKSLSDIVNPECIIASNTSSLSITSLAACVNQAERFIGIHFFNPAPLMPLVEIIPALQTSQQCIDTACALIQAWQKTIVLTKDTPGFIVNRIARPYYGEAIRIFEEGIATMIEIDYTMKQLGGFRMGPFELMDFIGHDVNYAVTESVWRSFYFDSRYKPSFTQKRLVEAGYLGRKSNKGFYVYPTQNTQDSIAIDPILSKKIFERILCMLINEAADALYLQIATRDDIETAMTRGVNYPKGLLKWADTFGIAHCVSILDYYFDFYHEDRYRCSPLLRQMNHNHQTFF